MKSVAEVLDDRDLRKELDAAWQSAFSTRRDLDHFLRIELNRNLGEFDGQEEVPLLVTKIALRRDESDDWVKSAFQGACLYRRKNQALWAFGAKVDWLPSVEAEMLPALQDLAEQPGTRRFLRIYGGDIRRSGDCAKAVGEIKQLHDLVDQLRRTVYLPVREAVQRLAEPSGRTYAGQLRGFLLELKRRISATAKPPCFAEGEFPWIDEQLAFAAVALRAAAETPAPGPVAEALGYLQDIVEIELPDLDRRLEYAARQLNLAGLVDRLRSLYEDLVGQELDRERLSALNGDIETLAKIDARLSGLIGLHQAWQRIDSALNPIENALDQPVDDVARRWRILSARLMAVCPSGYEECLPGLEAAVAAVSAALEARDIARLGLDFPDLSTLLRDRFTGIDRDLLEECDRISAVGDSLNAVVEKIDG